MKKILLIVSLITNLCYSSVAELCSDLEASLIQCYDQSIECTENNYLLKILLNRLIEKYPELKPLLEINIRNCIPDRETLNNILKKLEKHRSGKKRLSQKKVLSLTKSAHKHLEITKKLVQIVKLQTELSKIFEVQADIIHQEYENAASQYKSKQKDFTVILLECQAHCQEMTTSFIQLEKKAKFCSWFTIETNIKEKITKTLQTLTLVQNNHDKFIVSSNEIEAINLNNQFYLSDTLAEYPKLVQYYKDMEKKTSQFIDIIKRVLKDIKQTRQFIKIEDQRYSLENVD